MDEYSPSCSSLDSTPISSDIDSDESSELSEGEPRGVRRFGLISAKGTYLEGVEKPTKFIETLMSL